MAHKQSRSSFLLKVAGVLLAFFLMGFLTGRCSGRKAERRKASKAQAVVSVVAAEPEVAAKVSEPVSTTAEVAAADPSAATDQVTEPADTVEEIHYVKSKFYYMKASPYEQHFKDLNEKHLEAAQKIGLRPFPTRASVAERVPELMKQKKIVKIETSPLYCVADLTSSHPYVIPKCASFLNELARRFQENSESKSRFIVSSVTRTDEDIRRLQRGNTNSTQTSAHRYATTIDIAYARYEIDPEKPIMTPELRVALAQVLRQMQEEGRCYVKHEKKQYCYHITVR